MHVETVANPQPPVMPYEFWASSRFRAAFQSRDMGMILHLYRTSHEHHDTFGPAGITQEQIATWLGLGQAQISVLERGVKKPDSLSKMISWAETLSIPEELLWFDLSDTAPVSSDTATDDTRESESTEEQLPDLPVESPQSAAESLAAEIRRRRIEAGLSQRDLARLGGYTRQYVSMAERPGNIPSSEIVRTLDSTLKADGALIEMRAAARTEQQNLRREHQTLLDKTADGVSEAWPGKLYNYPTGTPQSLLESDEWTGAENERLSALASADSRPMLGHGDVLHMAHQWMALEPPQVAESSLGRRIGQGAVAQVENRVAHIRRMDDFVAGRDLREVVEKELVGTSQLIKATSYTSQVGSRLLVAIGELCQLAGWVNDDAGRYRHAAHYYGTGINAAYAANDVPLAGNLISTLSYQLANVGDPRDAILLARTAIRGTGNNATAKTRALLWERAAYAHARAGERRATELALVEVEKLYSRSKSESEPEWVYWLDEAEINIMAGRCFVELGEPERAIALLEKEIVKYSDERAREAALYKSWLAEAHIIAGNIEEAVSIATGALELTVATASTRSDDRIKSLLSQFYEYSDSPLVGDFIEYARTMGVSIR